MRKKTRFILFFFLVILFFFVTPSIIFYSQGYRFDFGNKKFVRTGGLYFKVQPRGAQIYLNDKLAKETDFLFSRALIDNLLPQQYKVEIKKEGYFPWEKNLEVQEKWVTEAKNISLVLENPKFNVLSDGIEDFFFSPDLKKILLKKKNGKGWFLSLFNLGRNTETLFLDEKEIGQGKIEFSDLEWSADSKKLLLKLRTGRPRYFIFEIEKDKLVPLDFLGKEISQVSFNPKNSQEIFFVQNLIKRGALFSIDYNKKEISKPILENLLTYQVLNNNLFWLDKDGVLYLSDLSGETNVPLNLDPFPLQPESQYELVVVSQKKIFLKEENALYFFNQEHRNLEKISEKIKEIRIAPDLKKIVYITDYEIWVLFLKEITDQPQKKEGEKLFLTRSSEEIGDVFWYTSHYLVFDTDNSIKITEIDDRDKINIYDLTKFENPKIFWNKTDKKLYILSEGNFYSSGKLLP